MSLSPHILVTIIIGVAFFAQSVSGFGAGLIAIALLALVLDLSVAVPMFALVALVAQGLILWRYRRGFSLAAVVRLGLASVVGSTIGVYLLDRVDGDLVLRVLGIIIVAYSLYALLELRLPRIENANWALGFGLVAGFLGGMYNIAGPPLIVYGTCRRWEPDEFRSNLQAIFIISTVAALINHFRFGNVTLVVCHYVLYALPGLLLGVLLGFVADHYINPVVFRKIVFVLLLLLGANLVL